MPRQPHICIVGGGPGGLFTAYHLQKYANQPVKLTIVEASDRLGGKIQTPRFNSCSTTYEAGAAELYDYSQHGEDPLRELVEELGLPVTRMEGSAVVLGDKLIANLDDLRTEFGPQCEAALREFDRRAETYLSPREFYLCDHATHCETDLMADGFRPFVDGIADATARQYVESLIHSDLATEPSRTNLEYGLHNYLMNNPRYMRLYSIDGGNERLPKALVERISAEYLMNTRATRVGRSENGRMFVDLADADGVTRHEFDSVVLAVPNVALPHIALDDAALRKAMDRHLAQYDHPAHYLRITILFDTPFWRGSFPESYVMHDAFGGCCLYDESLRNPACPQGVMGWLLAGENAKAMSETDDQTLINMAIDSLPGFLPNARPHFVEGVVKRWISAVNAMPGGRCPVPLDLRHQPEPTRHPNLFLVGDYLFDSTLNGVLDSAEYVAGRIAATLNERNGLAT